MGAGLYPQDQVNSASAEELRSMVNSLSNALRDMRLSAAHYKLQYSMAVMESQESASRMAVELAMAQRELDVLQQAEEKRRTAIAMPDQSYQESANAANAIMLSEMNRQNQMLQSENEELRDLFDQQKRLTEHREGELASLMEENDRLKTRIRENRAHIAPLLEQIEQSSPRSNFGTPHQPTQEPVAVEYRPHCPRKAEGRTTLRRSC
jgi:chromosome segregation ATPase